MYLEAIQKLSMFILRKEKTGAELSTADHASKLDQDTVANIRSLMDENVFDLLDKTECKVL